MGRGLIARFEKFALHDGPGIRTVIFVKGCPLRCIWCSSPQTTNSFQEIAYYEELCIGCGGCVEVCPEKAIHIDKQRKKHINRSKCTRCGRCADACPADALKIIGQFMSVAQVIEEVLKDKLFYEKSKGGVTISGGEPLMQIGFTEEILRKCHRHNIHTAVETSGYAKWDDIKHVMNHVDLLFFDIKHMNTERHEQLTGVTNEIILENLQRIDIECSVPVTVRFPLIPGLNDSQENLTHLSQFIGSLKRIKTLEIIPYHKLGEHEYKTLGKDYKLKGTKVPADDYLLKIRDFMKAKVQNVEVSRLFQK